MNIKRTILLLIAVATAGCRLIDDDLTVCGVDALINYELRLVTEVQLQIEEKLSSDIDKPVADALKQWSAPYYSGSAHDLDMSFFSLDGTDELLEHKSDIINANQKSYTLFIPRKDYRHVAVVNIANNNNVSLQGGQYASSMRIVQRNADTLDSHNTAIYAQPSASVYSAVNSTLVLETRADDGANGSDVYVALEFLNTGDDFYGIDHQMIPAGARFYLVGKLEADDATQTDLKVFKQDYTTTARFSINNLTKAYNTIPDLKAKQLEIGMSVDLYWTAGHTYDIAFE